MKPIILEFKNGIKNAISNTPVETHLARGLFVLAGLLIAGATFAQTKEQSTVRIKKTETINGVKKVTDTTYTTGDVSSIVMTDGVININGLSDEMTEGGFKTIILHDKTGTEIALDEDLGKHIDEEVKKALKEAGVDVTGKDLDQLGEQIDMEVKKALKEAGIEDASILRQAQQPGSATATKGEKILIINGTGSSTSSATGGKAEGKNIVITKTMIRHVDIKDADEKELKRLGQSNGDKENKLKLSNMNFYPNPNTGKFNLSFNLPEKGDAEVTILNTEGKIVYSEKLPAFSGSYDKEIDISKQAKGIYFVKVEQGKNAQVKKIVLD
jgi:hypothetical protein